MRKNEKNLFFELCKFCGPDKKRTGRLIEQGAATPAVLGELFFNRMAAVAYGVLSETGLIDKVNREFRNSLQNAYLQNIERNKSYFDCLKQLYLVLEGSGAPYAMLKGAYLCVWYPEGYRASNDVDLLVHPNDITSVGNALVAAGFSQGYIKGGGFIPASRQQIIESKMLRGETVPYIKEVGLPFMRYLEVDVNFSLDYQNGAADPVKEIIGRAEKTEIDGITLRIPERHDFFLHLCAHLYKEATTYPWVLMRRDMTLYKYCDIYSLLSDMPLDCDIIADRAQRYGLCDALALSLLHTDALLGVDENISNLMLALLLDYDIDAPDKVISPSGRKIYRYREPDVAKRFFSDDRVKLLEDITHEKTQNV